MVGLSKLDSHVQELTYKRSEEALDDLSVIVHHAKRARRALCSVKSYNARPDKDEDDSELVPQASTSTRPEYVSTQGQVELGQGNAEPPSLHTEQQDVPRAWEEVGESEATRETRIPWNCVWALEDEIQDLQQ